MNELQQRLQAILKEVDEVEKLIEPYKNEQFVLDYLDELNQHSIKY